MNIRNEIYALKNLNKSKIGKFYIYDRSNFQFRYFQHSTPSGK